MMARLKTLQVMVFMSVWVLYASTYLIRKPLGVMKVGLSSELRLGKTQLGWLDTAILLPYSVVQMLCGQAADRAGPRRTVTACLFLAGLSVLTFGYWSNYWMLVLFLALSGAVQAPVWPACCKCLAAWFPDNRINTMFGLVSTSAYGGSIIATALASYLISAYGWRFVYFPLAVVVMGLALVAWLVLKMPRECQALIPGKEPLLDRPQVKNMSLRELWGMSMVPQLAVAMMALKLVRYCVYLWLPVYLMQGLGLSAANAGWLLILFDVGGIAGSMVLGYIADRHSSLLHTWLAVVGSSIAFLLFLVSADWGLVYNASLLTVAGACICGPDALLGGSVAVSIGERDGRNAGAAVAGFVNGFGSLGGVLEGPLVGYVSDTYGWTTMFLLIIALLSVGSLSLLQAFLIHKRQAQMSGLILYQNGV